MCIYIFSFSLADSVLLEAELQFYHPHSFNFTTCQLYCLLLEVFFFFLLINVHLHVLWRSCWNTDFYTLIMWSNSFPIHMYSFSVILSYEVEWTCLCVSQCTGAAYPKCHFYASFLLLPFKCDFFQVVLRWSRPAGLRGLNQSVLKGKLSPKLLPPLLVLFCHVLSAPFCFCLIKFLLRLY